MHPLLFVALLAVAALAMVYAMVQFSLAHLRREDPGRWLGAYLLTWGAMAAILVMYLRAEPGALRANAAVLIGFPLGWFALHALILRFGAAIRDAPEPVPGPTAAPAEEDADGSVEVIPRPDPTLFERAVVATIRLVRLIAFLVVIGLIMAIGEELEILRAIDARLLPYRPQLVPILAALIATGFAAFMGGIIYFVLTGGQSGTLTLRGGNVPIVIVAGVLLLVLSAAALGALVLPAGVKLVLIVFFAYALVRAVIGTIRRTRGTSAVRR